MFGTHKVPREQILAQLHPPAPGTLVDFGKGDFDHQLIVAKKRLLAMGAFASVGFTDASYDDGTDAVTADVVEKGDEWRMNFNPAPTGHPPDPDGLIAAWAGYQKRLWQLKTSGAIPLYRPGTCKAIVCHGGFGHPELAPLETKFVNGVPAHFDAIVRVLHEDADAEHRMHAAMLLAYGRSRERVVQALLPSTRDPDVGVRNEVFRLLGAVQHGVDHEIVPIGPVVDALWFPHGTDRNKAGWALARIVAVDHATHAKQIAQAAGEILLEMAEARQRIYTEPSRLVLGGICGTRGEPDLAAWRECVERLRTASAEGR